MKLTLGNSEKISLIKCVSKVNPLDDKSILPRFGSFVPNEEPCPDKDVNSVLSNLYNVAKTMKTTFKSRFLFK